MASLQIYFSMHNNAKIYNVYWKLPLAEEKHPLRVSRMKCFHILGSPNNFLGHSLNFL